MKSFGIIAEYNPFHSGHKYLIDTASALAEADVCVSVMSGNFVQRGGPAFYDKWKRAELAVKNGVDLVVELPQVYASASASYFASAGVRILNALGCEKIAFGSETGDVDELKEYAHALRETEKLYMDEIKAEVGLSYPAARSKVLAKHYKDLSKEAYSGSNNILGIEYLNAIDKYRLDMDPVVLKRKGDSHSESASKERLRLLKNKEERHRWDTVELKYYDLIRGKILSMESHELARVDIASEGLENKLKKEVLKANSLDELLEGMKSKRYTRTRISRLLSHLALGIWPEDYREEVTYIRPLAFNEKGRKYLREIKKTTQVLEDIAKAMKYMDDESVKNALRIDIAGSDIYNLLSGQSLYENSDYVKKPAVLSL